MTGACSQCGKPWSEKSTDCVRHESFNERAALIEFDGKKSRAEAERLAVAEMARAKVAR